MNKAQIESMIKASEAMNRLIIEFKELAIGFAQAIPGFCKAIKDSTNQVRLNDKEQKDE